MAKKDSRKFVSNLARDVVREGEALHKAVCVTFVSQFDNPKKLASPGGMCSCCGAGPRVDGVFDWWLVFRAGLCDADGEYMAMLCGGPDGSGCLPDIRSDAGKRKPTSRDEAASIVSELMGDDLDGAQAFMEDLEFMGGFGEQGRRT